MTEAIRRAADDLSNPAVDLFFVRLVGRRASASGRPQGKLARTSRRVGIVVLLAPSVSTPIRNTVTRDLIIQAIDFYRKQATCQRKY